MSRYQIYIDGDVLRSLTLIAQTKPRPRTDSYDQQGISMMTADEMADQILRKAINERWPQIAEHQKQVKQLEKELQQTL